MSELPVVSGVDAVRAFAKLGYCVDRQTGSHMILRQRVNVRGEFDAEAHPQVREAIDVAWQIRRFAIRLDFEPERAGP